MFLPYLQKQLSQQKSEDPGATGEPAVTPVSPPIQEVVVNGTSTVPPPGNRTFSTGLSFLYTVNTSPFKDNRDDFKNKCKMGVNY